ncbi:hypothetical protein H6P81_021698 [Aristolochia fimbriata]|uniref:Uncharacterized protein n=1 Tax=Aristolochia fimbriata TaxID=158543 RepID=A0AAV7DSA3_ARIFI|nr:hypothetical protein H6P81_021698 [Aristolochia fimbriata]
MCNNTRRNQSSPGNVCLLPHDHTPAGITARNLRGAAGQTLLAEPTERPVQILVVVAIFKMRTLKVKRGKDSASRQPVEGESVKNSEPDVGLDGNARESGDARAYRKSYLFCLTARPPGNVLPESRVRTEARRTHGPKIRFHRNSIVVSQGKWNSPGKGLELRVGKGSPKMDPTCREKKGLAQTVTLVGIELPPLNANAFNSSNRNWDKSQFRPPRQPAGLPSPQRGRPGTCPRGQERRWGAGAGLHRAGPSQRAPRLRHQTPRKAEGQRRRGKGKITAAPGPRFPRRRDASRTPRELLVASAEGPR